MSDTKPKWTPGPWQPEPGAGRGAWIKNTAGNWAAIACGDSSNDEARANANLISAAPDLYAALDAVMDSNSFNVHELADWSDKKAYRGLVAQIAAALAKARGEQP